MENIILSYFTSFMSAILIIYSQGKPSNKSGMHIYSLYSHGIDQNENDL